jgi:hypothetical protein
MADYTYAIVMLDWEMSLDGGCMMRPHRHYVQVNLAVRACSRLIVQKRSKSMSSLPYLSRMSRLAGIQATSKLSQLWRQFEYIDSPSKFFESSMTCMHHMGIKTT